MRFISRLSLPRTLAVFLAAACWMQSANAGTKGSLINTFGRGVAVNTVVYNGVTNTAKSTLTSNPSSAVYDFNNPLDGLDPADPSVTQTSLPSGTPKEVYSRSLGTAPGVWTWDAFVMDGATADNPALTAKLPIVPAGFAKYKVKSTSFVDGLNKIGYLALEGFATKGAGVWLRAIEFKGNGDPLDIEDLVANGTLKGEVTLAGPFFFDPTNCTAIRFPFTFEGDADKVYFVADGVALSVPFTVSSLDLNGQCGVPVNYPPATVAGGSGTNTVDYMPASGSTFGYGTTIVTMIATDTYLGLKKTNIFKVTVNDNTPPVAPTLANVTGQCSASVAAPTALDACAGTITGTTLNPTTYNSQGTYTVVWTFNDGNGNSSTANQTVIIAGAQFIGPDSPLSPQNSNCATPFSAKKRTTIPFKFQLKCGDSYITTGSGPIVSFQKFLSCTPTSSEPIVYDTSTYYQNAWHENWTTPNTVGLYKVTFTLNGVALKSVWVTVTN